MTIADDGNGRSPRGWGIGASGMALDPSARGRAQRRSEGELARGSGTRLYFSEWAPDDAGPPLRALVFVMHGYAEHSARYDELALHLVQRGYAVARMDARGHGRSSGRRGHVLDFDEYVDDLAAFVLDRQRRHPQLRTILLGHSNGGLTAIRCVQRGLVAPHALVLTSPLLRLPKRPVPDGLARVLSRCLPALPLPNGIRSEQLTHDVRLREAHALDGLVHKWATPRWYWSMRQAQRRAMDEASEIRLPLLIICGERDPLVDPSAAVEFHALVASADKELLMRTGEYHEVLNEVARLQSFETITAWMQRVLGADGQAPVQARAPSAS